MFFPNEIITEILNNMDYLTWRDKVDLLNQEYHSLIKYYDQDDSLIKYYDKDGFDFELNYHEALCTKHGRFIANWRNNHFYTKYTESYIYPMDIKTRVVKCKDSLISSH